MLAVTPCELDACRDVLRGDQEDSMPLIVHVCGIERRPEDAPQVGHVTALVVHKPGEVTMLTAVEPPEAAAMQMP